MDMNGLTQNVNDRQSSVKSSGAGTGKAAGSNQRSGRSQAAVQNQTVPESKAGESASSGKKNPVGGRTIGNPQLSEKAMKYYEQLKKKYGDMEFILVSPDKKEEAQRNAASMKGSKGLVVLIDTEKIEKMAEDENYRKQYENILDNAGVQIAKISVSLGSDSKKVRNYGLKFDDHGNASFFAVIDKSLAAQKDRIASKKLESAKDKKEAARKASEERLRDQIEQAGGKRSDKTDKEDFGTGDTITVTAGSWDELLSKIKDALWEEKADHLLTEEEKKIGQSIDYSL